MNQNGTFPFKNSLDAATLSMFNSLTQKQAANIAVFFDKNGRNTETEAFAQEVIGYLSDNPNSDININDFTLDDSIDENNSIIINDSNDLNNILNNQTYSLETVENDGNLGTVKINLGYCSVEIDIAFDTNPFEVNNISTSLNGFVLGVGFEQDEDINITGENTNIATVHYEGNLKYSLFWSGVGTFYSTKRRFDIKINTNTGEIIAVEEIDN